MASDGVPHDLAEHRLARTGPDVAAAGEDGQPEEHRAEDDAQQKLGPLGPHDPRLFEQRDPVRDRLHAGERAAPGREGL